MLGKFRFAYFGATVLYLASGAITLGAAVTLMKEVSTEGLMALIFEGTSLQIFMVSGIVALFSAVTGMFGLVNPINRRATLRLYGATILVVAALQLVVACISWFDTLRLRAFLEANWLGKLSEADVNGFQNKFSCCGFANITDKAVISPACAADDPAAAAKPGCRDPVASSAQGMLINFYTAIFAAIFVDFFAFLACVIMAQYRVDEARFRKIDAKNLAGPGKVIGI